MLRCPRTYSGRRTGRQDGRCAPSAFPRTATDGPAGTVFPARCVPGAGGVSPCSLTRASCRCGRRTCRSGRLRRGRHLHDDAGALGHGLVAAVAVQVGGGEAGLCDALPQPATQVPSTSSRKAWPGCLTSCGSSSRCAVRPPVAGAELLRLPVVERLVGGPRQRVWCFDCVTEFAEDSGGFLGHVSHNGGSLAAPPPFTTCFDVLAPSRFGVEFALADQELDEIFQARAEPTESLAS